MPSAFRDTAQNFSVRFSPPSTSGKKKPFEVVLDGPELIMLVIDPIDSEAKKIALFDGVCASFTDTEWLGEAAKRLSLHGSVKEAEIWNLFHGITPDGEVDISPEFTRRAGLGPRQESSDAIDGWVFLFSPPPRMVAMHQDGEWRFFRHLKSIHTEAVLGVISAFEQKFISLPSAGKESALFAKIEFRELPLPTITIFFNSSFHEGGKATRIDPNTITSATEELSALYHQKLSLQLLSEAGLHVSSLDQMDARKASSLTIQNPFVRSHQKQDKFESETENNSRPSPAAVRDYWNTHGPNDSIKTSSPQSSHGKSNAQKMRH